MTIKVSRVSDGFQFFPYPPDEADDRTNIGGIDLIRNPERIGELPELSSLPSLRGILTRLNGPRSRFITLGVEASEQDGNYVGYIEFAFRDSGMASHEEHYYKLLSLFEDWLFRKFQVHAESIQKSFVAELQHFHLHGEPHGDRLTLWFQALNQGACDELLCILEDFLFEKYESNGA